MDERSEPRPDDVRSAAPSDDAAPEAARARETTTREETAPEAGAPDTRAAEVEALRRELQERQDRLLRALAETENVRRRSQREREEYVKYATESLLRDLIPVLDNFDRAIAAARAGRDTASVAEGVELIQRDLLKVLERAGLTRYSAVGQRFDPTVHEAVGRVVSADHAPDTVTGEIAPGYALHGRVLRAAMVTVAVAPDEDAA
ncbi:MAG TPA: nucleotide exchange factor GrpE [Candidatus Tectomicrobia bacterium]|nr:nucleotide exchange factor GrpE [Candidatus Tectomicrobia bacterium]